MITYKRLHISFCERGRMCRTVNQTVELYTLFTFVLYLYQWYFKNKKIDNKPLFQFKDFNIIV